MHGLNFNVVSELSPEGGSIFAEVPPTEAYPARAEELARRAPAVVLETRADGFFSKGHVQETKITQAMSTYDVARMSQFSQVMAKIPPSFDGNTSWLAFEDAVDGLV